MSETAERDGKPPKDPRRSGADEQWQDGSPKPDAAGQSENSSCIVRALHSVPDQILRAMTIQQLQSPGDRIEAMGFAPGRLSSILSKILQWDEGLRPDATETSNASHAPECRLDELMDRYLAVRACWDDDHISRVSQWIGRQELTQPRLVPVSVYDLIEGCIASIRPMATEQAVILRVVRFPNAPRQILGDPARAHRVLVDLLGNAVNTTRVGGVELRSLACAMPGWLRIEVAEIGPDVGQLACVRPRPGSERLDSSGPLGRIDPPFAGTTQIVELIGGAIGQTHSADGGTVFWLELPTGDLATLSKPVPDMSLPSGKHVLLVDDNATNRDVIASFLRVAGHDVTMAKNGKEAVQLAQDRTFDLVLMDVRMPEMDGLEATRRIRILPAGHGSAPVIALTAYTSEDQVTQCEDVGMTGHIAKPVDYSTLMRAVTHAMV